MLDRCLDALAASSGVAGIVVVDNSATGRELHERHSVDHVRTVNRGLGAAANVGVARATALHVGNRHYVGLLNDDAVVECDWVEPLVEALDADAGLGAVQPKLLVAGSDPPMINSVGVVIDPAGAGSDVGDGLLDGPWWSTFREVVMFTGGAVVFRTAFLDDIGGFDERYFLYYEDVDLALRGGRQGWRFACEPASVVWHERSATTRLLGPELRRLQERNRLWIAVRFGSPSMAARALWLSARRLRHAPHRAHVHGLLSGLVGAPRRLAERCRRGGARDLLADPRARPTVRRGVNVLGYHHVSSGLGTVARTVHRSLLAAGVPTRAVDIPSTDSPRLRDPAVGSDVVPHEIFDVTIAVVAAEALPGVIEANPRLRSSSGLFVGCFFWELAAAPPTHRYAIDLVDEIWAPTRFIAEAYSGSERPVSVCPVRLEEPEVHDVDVNGWRRRLGIGDEAFVFLVSFDYFSSVDRKNPFAAIEAFAEAFADVPSREVRLVIKSINGSLRTGDHDRVVDAVGADRRILMVDEHVDAAQLDALVAAADCLVSLHRGEGLGLHLASAMWLGTPVLASRYSGNLDFMDDESAALVDVEIVAVEDHSGAYPPDAVWASPKHDQVVAWMRRLVVDADVGRRLADAALDRMRSQPTHEEFGRHYWSAAHATPGLFARTGAPAGGYRTGEPSRRRGS
jgi:N-acetylglucosaminyl-diphospho-decaprenol L-rhamnosyltransferase